MQPPAAVDLVPLPRAPRHVWAVPGSKSITNRALVLAALAAGESELSGWLDADDTWRMRDCLAGLGIAIRESAAGGLRVFGGVERLRAPDGELRVGNSGTTVRFLSAVAALVPGACTFVGDRYMAARPIADLVGALEALGVGVDCASGCPPLTIHGGGVGGGRVVLRGDRSSQFVSALLMIGPYLPGGLELGIDGQLVSRPYVEITLGMLGDFGAEARTTGDGFRVAEGACRPRAYAVEPDASAAGYPFAAAAATGGRICVPGLSRTSRQGDLAFLAVLERMGCRVEENTSGLCVTGPARPAGIDADLYHLSDQVPTLAALAPLCAGPVVIRNVANIRHKETDRLAACANELRRLGQEVAVGEDWLRIEPRPLTPAAIECYGDHRMAMAFAVLGLARPGVTIADPACVAKTYPGFWRDLAGLYEASGCPAPWAG